MNTTIHAAGRDPATSGVLGRLMLLFTLATLLTGCFWEGSDERKLKIVAEPADVTVVAGATATFTVQVNGGKTTYQWRRNGSDIAGATTATYTTPATVAADDGALYSVVATRGNRTLTSRNAKLTVNVPPAISTQPASITVAEGATATFSVTASGTAPLSYQWRRGGTNIAGATAATYTTPATVAGDNGAVFSVVVTNVAGNVTSSNATLTVTSTPVFSGAWGSMKSLDNADDRIRDHTLAVDRETGDAVAAWTTQTVGTDPREAVYASLYDSGTDTWSAPQLIGVATLTNNYEFAAGVRAAINSGGDIVVAWNQNINESTGNKGTVRAARYKPGTGWSVVYQLTRIPGGPEPDITWTGDLDVAMDFAGNATVIWTEQYSYPTFELVASARMPATGSFQTAQLLESTQNTRESENVRIVMDYAGNATAIWFRETPSGTKEVVTQRRAALASGWDNETRLVVLTGGGYLDYPRMAVNPTSGDVLAVWRQETATSGMYQIMYATYAAATSSWRPAARADSSADESGIADVAINSLGKGVMVRENYGTTDNVVVSRIDMATGVFGPETTIATNAFIPAVGIDLSGNIMVAYNDGLVWARRLTNDGALGFPLRMSETSVVTEIAGLGVTDEGTAVVAWSQGFMGSFGSIYMTSNLYARAFR